MSTNWTYKNVDVTEEMWKTLHKEIESKSKSQTDIENDILKIWNDSLTKMNNTTPNEENDYIVPMTNERDYGEDRHSQFQSVKSKRPDYFPDGKIWVDKFKDANDKGGIKFDKDKPRYELVPPEALEATVRVLTIGAKKYSDDNWKNVEKERYIGAAFRHLNAIHRGEEIDPETGEKHAAHLACCAWFLHELKD